MKIENIIKNALVERRLISEDEVGQQPSGQSTRSFDLNNPEDVINAAQQYDCWKQWGLDKKPIDSTTKKEQKFSYRNQEKSIPAGTRFLYSDPLIFFGEKIQGETDKDNTYFYGFDKSNLSTSTNLFKGFRWTCKSLRSVDQAGTRNITPAQQIVLDNYISTFGSVYTKVGGIGQVAKDISELQKPDGTTIWDENVGVPPKGNYVYIQKALYNIKPNQLLGIADSLDKKGWTLKEPLMDTPEYTAKRRMIDLFPDLKSYGLTSDVMIYPKDASTLSGVTMDRKIGGGEKLNKEVCKPAIQFLVKCMNSGGQSTGCNDSNRVNNEKYTAARCYVSTIQKPQFKGILGLGNELSLLYNNPNRLKFGIGNEVSQIQRNTKNTNVNEASLTSTIKNHLLENIRNKNSQL
jgi:hypothetical protein